LSTSLLATLVALARIPLARTGSGAWTGALGDGARGDARTGWYVVGVELASLAATGLMHLLIAFTARPVRTFGWVMATATAVAMLAPLATSAGLPWSLATAAFNLLLGVAIATLVARTARAAMNRRRSTVIDPAA
jgi:hypothetical protein